MSKSDPVDKDHLYGKFQRALDWRQKLDEKLAHKSLDIPMDGEDMNVDNSKHGWGWKEVLAVGAVGLGLAFAFRPPTVPAPPAPVPVVSPSDMVDTDTWRRRTIKPYQPEGQ